MLGIWDPGSRDESCCESWDLVQCWIIPRVAWGCGTESRLLFLRMILQEFLEAERCCLNCLSEFIDHTIDRHVLFVLSNQCSQCPTVVACFKQGGTVLWTDSFPNRQIFSPLGLDRCNGTWPWKTRRCSAYLGRGSKMKGFLYRSTVLNINCLGIFSSVSLEFCHSFLLNGMEL